MVSRRERVLTIFFAVLFFISLLYLVLGVASVPGFYQRVTTQTVEPYRVGTETLVSNEVVAEKAAARGLTLSQYALEQILFSVAFAALFIVFALLLVRHAGWNWFAWFTAFFLIFVGGSAFQIEVMVAQLVPPALYEFSALFWPLVLIYFFLFPNGKPVPRRALWVILPIVLVHFTFQLLAFLLVLAPQLGGQADLEPLSQFVNAMIGVAFVLLLGCQVYRYLRVSTPLEKQQTKWFVFGLVITVLVTVLEDFTSFKDEVDLLFFAFVPLSVGVAILRYRLWDIDFIIRRTVTYGLVTGLLLIAFLGSVVVLQQVFASLTGATQDDLVTVLSTLVIAALFIPLRNRVQTVIDRRFNRKRYNAQIVLQQFATTVRDETDLERLSNELVTVVNETMQPKSVGLWLRREAGMRDEG